MGEPAFGDVRTVSNGGTVGPANTPGTAVPENATTLLYGAVTELISAANNIQDSWGIEIDVFETGASAAACEAAVDILIGGATDDVLISSLLVGGAYAASPRSFFFPLNIPAGVRIAAQLASVRTGITPDPTVLVTLYGGTPPPFKTGSKVITYGSKINNARGVAITPGASGAAATATEIVASTTDPAFYLLPGYQVSVDTTLGLAWTAVGIGVGASTEERIGTWWHGKSAAEHQVAWLPTLGAFRNVPAGSRLTILASTGAAADSNQDALIYAVT